MLLLHFIIQQSISHHKLVFHATKGLNFICALKTICNSLLSRNSKFNVLYKKLQVDFLQKTSWSITTTVLNFINSTLKTQELSLYSKSISGNYCNETVRLIMFINWSKVDRLFLLPHCFFSHFLYQSTTGSKKDVRKV